jgi:hypothetical protein
MLAEDAIKSAIRDYRSKRQGISPTIGPEATVATTDVLIADAAIGPAVSHPVV